MTFTFYWTDPQTLDRYEQTFKGFDSLQEAISEWFKFWEYSSLKDVKHLHIEQRM